MTWPAGLFPSPAELNSFSALWLVPVWAGTAEWVSESWAGPVVAGWGRGSRSELGRRPPPGRRGPGCASQVWCLEGVRLGRLGRVIGDWQWTAVRPASPRPVAPGQVCFLNIVWGGLPWPSCSVTGSGARSVMICRGPAAGCRCQDCRGRGRVVVRPCGRTRAVRVRCDRGPCPAVRVGD